MRVERYQEVDMRSAMAKVRSELGKDAVIISSREVGGRIEIMAASDCDPEQVQAELKKLSLENTDSNIKQRSSLNSSLNSNLNSAVNSTVNINSDGHRDRADNESAYERINERSKKEDNNERLWNTFGKPKESLVESSPSFFDMQSELARLRKLFESELAQLAWRDEGSRQPNRSALLSRLETAEISRDIASKIVEKVLPCNDIELAWKRVLRILSQVIKISDLDVMNNGGVIAMIGATGVGKTTTAAKIAAQFALRHGRNEVAFITTDTTRVGAHEQLISFGSLLGVPVQVVKNHDEMQNTLDSFSARKLVIIDTAGISQKDESLASQFKALANNNIEIHPHLVLSATAQESVINETIKAFSSINLSAAIITKTDESSRMGAVMSGLIRNKLPAAFIADGQKVPEDLFQARKEMFIDNIKSTNELQQKKQEKKQQNIMEIQKKVSNV